MSKDLKQTALNRIGELSKEAVDLWLHSTPTPATRQVNMATFIGWRTRCLVFLGDFLGDNHLYSQQFSTAVTKPFVDDVSAGGAILSAIRKDVNGGYLGTLQELVHADMFGNFLDMAEYLLGGGMKDPAAVLVSGVLEQHLRQLSLKHGIAVEIDTAKGPQPKSAEDMNVDLYKKGVYNTSTQKQVLAWLDIRNKAAHAHWDQYRDRQIVRMLDGVRDFVSDYKA